MVFLLWAGLGTAWKVTLSSGAHQRRRQDGSLFHKEQDGSNEKQRTQKYMPRSFEYLRSVIYKRARTYLPGGVALVNDISPMAIKSILISQILWSSGLVTLQ